MKKITLFRKNGNYGAKFYEGSKLTSWEKLTHDEKEDLLNAMWTMYNFFLIFLQNEEQ